MAKQPQDIQKRATDYVVEAVSFVLSTAPYTGGLAAYLNEYYPDQVKRTISDFKQTLVDHANNIDRVDCDFSRLTSLVSEIFLEIPKTSCEEKRQAFRSLLLNYASGKPISPNELDVFVSLLSSITELNSGYCEPWEVLDPKPLVAISSSLGNSPGWKNVEVVRLLEGTDEAVLRLAYNDLCQKLLLDGPSLPDQCLDHPFVLDIYGSRLSARDLSSGFAGNYELIPIAWSSIFGTVEGVVEK